MELKILSPQEGGFVKEILWNNEELKAEIAAKMQEYKSLAFTAETIQEAKKDRAKLNKLRTAFEDERKKVKKKCMEPYEKFERQVKELTALIDEPILLIDDQIKEVEQAKREEKKKAVEELFVSIGFQPLVTLQSIWDDKWLNATASLGKIEEQMRSKMYQVGQEVMTIHNLPEFSFEAMEVYKKTLDLTKAIQEGQRLSEIQKRKVAYEEEQCRKKEEAERAAREKAEQKLDVVDLSSSMQTFEAKEEIVKEPEPQVFMMDFRVWGTREQLLQLRQFMMDNNIKFGKVE